MNWIAGFSSAKTLYFSLLFFGSVKHEKRQLYKIEKSDSRLYGLTCWHVRNSATHTHMPARPWAVFVWRNIPSPTWLRGSLIASAAECDSSVVTLAIDCVGAVVVVVVAVEFNTSGDGPDIIYLLSLNKNPKYSHSTEYSTIFFSALIVSL